MDGWSAKVSCQAICVLELMTQRLPDRKPFYRPWLLSTEQAHRQELRHSASAYCPDTHQPPDIDSVYLGEHTFTAFLFAISPKKHNPHIDEALGLFQSESKTRTTKLTYRTATIFLTPDSICRILSQLTIFDSN